MTKDRFDMRILNKTIFLVIQGILLFFPFLIYGQITVPAKCDLTSGGIYTLPEYNGNAYPLYFSLGTQSTDTDGSFINDLPTDAFYANANNPGRWKDEQIGCMSFRGNTGTQRACFQFRADVTGRASITVEWVVGTVSFNSNTNYIELQWKNASVGGSWNDVEDDMFIQEITPDGTLFSVELPAAANDLADLRIRWIYYEIGTGIRDRLNIDDIVITTAPKALPVELSKFIGSRKAGGILLEWQTLLEQNNREFIVEHSNDLIDFIQLGKVQGEGTSTKTHNYSFSDDKPQNGTNYYRLRQVDYDGKEEMSKIISVDINSDQALKAYYDQGGQITVELSNSSYADESYQLELVDNYQRVLFSKNFDSDRTTIQIPVSKLNSGIYYVCLINKNIRKTVKLLVP